MKVREQTAWATAFFDQSLQTLARKGPDYAPEDVVFLDVVKRAAEDETTPEQVLWNHMQKHLTALRKFVLTGRVESEPVNGRTTDSANFLALIDFYVHNRVRILEDVLDRLLHDPCDEGGPGSCASRYGDLRVHEWCARCKGVVWCEKLQRAARGCDSQPTSLLVTPKLPGL